MAKKMPALQGPLKTWVQGGWRFHRWGDEARYTHPRAIAVKLTPRGEGVQECARLMRTHAWKIGAWYILPADKIPKLRGVWVAGFRRCPTDYEATQGRVFTVEELQEMGEYC